MLIDPRYRKKNVLLTLRCMQDIAEYNKGDVAQSKTLFLAIYDPRSSIVWSVLDCHLPGMIKRTVNRILYTTKQNIKQ